MLTIIDTSINMILAALAIISKAEKRHDHFMKDSKQIYQNKN